LLSLPFGLLRVPAAVTGDSGRVHLRTLSQSFACMQLYALRFSLQDIPQTTSLPWLRVRTRQLMFQFTREERITSWSSRSMIEGWREPSTVAKLDVKRSAICGRFIMMCLSSGSVEALIWTTKVFTPPSL